MSTAENDTIVDDAIDFVSEYGKTIEDILEDEKGFYIEHYTDGVEQHGAVTQGVLEKVYLPEALQQAYEII